MSQPDLARPEAANPELQTLAQGGETAERLLRVLSALQANVEERHDDDQPQHLGAFRLVRKLGAGGMGEVWLGERADGQVEQRVAIKRLRMASPLLRQQLLAERRILARLDHPGIAGFIDAGVDAEGQPYLVMEYVEGTDLIDWCDRAELGLAQRLALLIEICEAVEHAHRHLVVHRDLKPGNILVRADGHPRLLDFGIAKLLDAPASGSTQALLTPAWAAPEQLREGAVGTATDVYALGLILVRLLTGSLPPARQQGELSAVLDALHAEESIQLAALATVRPVPKIHSSSLRGDLQAIASQALRFDPAARYGSVQALREDLQRYLAQQPVRARAPTRAYILRRFLARHRAASVMAGLALVALVAGLAVALLQAQRAQQASVLAQQAALRAERSNAFLVGMFREQDPFAREQASARPAAELLRLGAADVLREFPDQAAIAAPLLSAIGMAQLRVGSLSEARATLIQARERLPTEARRAVDLALLDVQIANAEIDAANAALAALETETSGLSATDRAQLAVRRARILIRRGQFDAALEAARAASSVFSQAAGVDPAELLAARAEELVALDQMRRDEEIPATVESTIALIETRLGMDHPWLIQPLLTHATAALRRRDFATAEADYQRALRLASAAFGPVHAQTARLQVRLANLANEQGQHQLASERYALAEQALPPDALVDRAQLHASRGRMRLDMGDPDGGESDWRIALELRRQNGGENLGLTLYTQSEWGRALAAQGKLDQALATQTEALSRLREAMGEQAYQNALLMDALATTETLRGKLKAAAGWSAQARALAEQRYPPTHPAVYMRQLAQARVLARLPQSHSEARALIEQMLGQIDLDQVDDVSLSEIAAVWLELLRAMGDAQTATAFRQRVGARLDSLSPAAADSGRIR